ncbi:MAG: flagellar hook-basal body complex protein, partial [Lachnospiraceae bacterium]|nr:flagellar hook-basal body complex protein [Lachnospiraceae bacterium]
MMRSLFSGVSGLKTHQTRMDVIGNNIANVNTTAYKSQNMVFSDLLYQTTQAASGANADTGRGGINARQIGLGAKTAAINTAITRQGSAQSTNNPWDVMISGESFFIVNSGSQNFFTRDGSFTIDGAGNLVMASTGYKVMGWQYDEDTGDIRSDVVSALQVMNRENLTAEAEATTRGYASGIVDKNDTSVHSSGGKVMSLKIFDAEGYDYSVLMSIHAMSKDGLYYVQLDDIKNADGVSLKDYYKVADISQIATFGNGGNMDPVSKVYAVPEGIDYTPANGNDPAKFLVNYQFEEILTNFGSNPMMSIAEAAGTLKVTQIDGKDVADGDKATSNSKVTMEGSAELTKDTLQRDYGITYDEKAKQYYYKDDKGDTVPLANEPRTEDEVNAWATVLGKLAGGVDINAPAAATDPSPIKVSEDGKVEVTFTAEFTPNRDDLQYNNASGKFAVPLEYVADGGPKDAEVLQRVYGLTDTDNIKYNLDYVTPDGHASVTVNESYNGNMLVFDTKTGKFSYIGAQGQNEAVLD